VHRKEGEDQQRPVTRISFVLYFRVKILTFFEELAFAAEAATGPAAALLFFGGMAVVL